MEKTKILIVEDEAIIAMELESQLQSLGHQVASVVDTGKDAIQKIELDRPDLIIMDIRIKGEMNGIETAEIVKNRFGIPVIFSTAYLDEKRIERAKITMPFGYVLKPIQERDLKVTIEMAIYIAEVDKKRQQVENALIKSEFKLAAHIKNTPMGVIEFDNEFKIISWNPSAEKIFGYSAEEAIGENTFDLIVPDYEHDKVKKVHQQENPIASENINDNKTKDGRFITCKWFNTPMMDINGKNVGLSAVCQDITEEKKVEQASQKKLISLTQPLGKTQNIHFEDLFNLNDIQKLQDQFAKATGVASIITQTNGEPITKPSNFCRLCNDIIRKTEKGNLNCYKSDATFGRYNPQGPTIQKCLSGGLCDAGAAITVDGRHIANWLIGQVRDESQNSDQITNYAREIGADEKQVATAFNEVPVMSFQQFESISAMLFTLANQLSTMAYQNMLQARYIDEQKKAELTKENYIK
ncbi:MAG: PAS domain S-box protein [Deltaproteobacteria bacterium]|jgi:PAS domain S-box-containing protein|nr:PAS domain S-box protein [Deltaproteobacteria bacterium]MBT4525986.1 PAS domain S-box protein [Deltaproteobacteria bacterium]